MTLSYQLPHGQISFATEMTVEVELIGHHALEVGSRDRSKILSDGGLEEGFFGSSVVFWSRECTPNSILPGLHSLKYIMHGAKAVYTCD